MPSNETTCLLIARATQRQTFLTKVLSSKHSSKEQSYDSPSAFLANDLSAAISCRRLLRNQILSIYSKIDGMMALLSTLASEIDDAEALII